MGNVDGHGGRPRVLYRLRVLGTSGGPAGGTTPGALRIVHSTGTVYNP